MFYTFGGTVQDCLKSNFCVKSGEIYLKNRMMVCNLLDAFFV